MSDRPTMARANILILALAVAAPGPARGAGFDYPDHGTAALSRGGAFVARSDDPSALYYNPAGATRLGGTNVLLGGNLIMESIRYQRRIYPIHGADASLTVAPDRYPHDPTQTMPEVHNEDAPFLSPLVSVTSDLGLLRPYRLVLMAGVYGPHVHPTRTYPRYCKTGSAPCISSVDSNDMPSPARYDTTYINTLVVYPSLGLAWQPLPGLSIGGVFQATYASLAFRTTLQAMPRTLGRQPMERPQDDVDIAADSTDPFTPTGIFGLHWQVNRSLELGASLRVGFPLEFEGEVTAEISDDLKKLFDMQPNPASISISLNMPWVVRAGVRYVNRDSRGRERLDVEVDLVWESTGQVESTEMQTDARILPLDQAPEGLTLPHNWKDAYSLRLGATYQLFDIVTDGVVSLSLGWLYESEVMPEEYTRLDFLPFERFGLSVGLGLRWGRYWFSVGYAHLFHPTREVAPAGGDGRSGTCAASGGSYGCGSQVDLLAPLNAELATPIGNGTYELDIDIVTLGATVRFGGE